MSIAHTAVGSTAEYVLIVAFADINDGDTNHATSNPPPVCFHNSAPPSGTRLRTWYHDPSSPARGKLLDVVDVDNGKPIRSELFWEAVARHACRQVNAPFRQPLRQFFIFIWDQRTPARSGSSSHGVAPTTFSWWPSAPSGILEWTTEILGPFLLPYWQGNFFLCPTHRSGHQKLDTIAVSDDVVPLRALVHNAPTFQTLVRVQLQTEELTSALERIHQGRQRRSLFGAIATAPVSKLATIAQFHRRVPVAHMASGRARKTTHERIQRISNSQKLGNVRSDSQCSKIPTRTSGFRSYISERLNQTSGWEDGLTRFDYAPYLHGRSARCAPYQVRDARQGLVVALSKAFVT